MANLLFELPASFLMIFAIGLTILIIIEMKKIRGISDKKSLKIIYITALIGMPLVVATRFIHDFFPSYNDIAFYVSLVWLVIFFILTLAVDIYQYKKGRMSDKHKELVPIIIGSLVLLAICIIIIVVLEDNQGTVL